MNKIPFSDLTIQYHNIKRELDPILSKVFQKGYYIGGEEVEKFEKEFARFIGTKYCISLNSGTDALILGTKALNYNPGEEIIFPANTYYATILSAVWNGLKPVLVDIDPKDFGYDLSDLKRKLNRRTRAVAVVHLYGQPDKFFEIQKLVRKRSRPIDLLEDAAQAHGSQILGRRVGALGLYGAFSFYPSKNLGAYGDGGAITTNNTRLMKSLRKLKEYGQSKKYHHDSIGTNSRLDTIQAAILRLKLKKITAWNKKRQDLGLQYTNLLKDVPQIETPTFYKDRKSIYHVYVVKTKKRNALQSYLAKKEITTLIHYPVPLHLQKAFRYLGYSKGDFPIAEQVSQEILSLPMFPELKQEQLNRVVSEIKKFFS